MSYQLSILNLVYRVFQVKRKEIVVFVAMEAELPWQQRIAYNMSTLKPMKLKFDMMRDIPQPSKCANFQLILT